MAQYGYVTLPLIILPPPAAIPCTATMTTTTTMAVITLANIFILADTVEKRILSTTAQVVQNMEADSPLDLKLVVATMTTAVLITDMEEPTSMHVRNDIWSILRVSNEELTFKQQTTWRCPRYHRTRAVSACRIRMPF